MSRSREPTPESNVTSQITGSKSSLLDIIGPMLPLLFAGAVNPGMFSGMGGDLTQLLSHLGVWRSIYQLAERRLDL